eukprot:15475511-Alexandrium_andersonii.AAC.1
MPTSRKDFVGLRKEGTASQLRRPLPFHGTAAEKDVPLEARAQKPPEKCFPSPASLRRCHAPASCRSCSRPGVFVVRVRVAGAALAPPRDTVDAALQEVAQMGVGPELRAADRQSHLVELEVLAWPSLASSPSLWPKAVRVPSLAQHCLQRKEPLQGAQQCTPPPEGHGWEGAAEEVHVLSVSALPETVLHEALEVLRPAQQPRQRRELVDEEPPPLHRGVHVFGQVVEHVQKARNRNRTPENEIPGWGVVLAPQGAAPVVRHHGLHVVPAGKLRPQSRRGEVGEAQLSPHVRRQADHGAQQFAKVLLAVGLHPEGVQEGRTLVDERPRPRPKRCRHWAV